MGFSQFLTILRARRALILSIVLVVVASVAGITTLLPKRYQASASVMVDQKIAYANAGPSALPGRPGDVITTQIDILTSPAVALRVVEELKLVERPDIGSLLAESNVLKRTWWTIRSLFTFDEEGPEPDLKNVIADAMLRNLSVKSNRDSYMLRITYAAPVPEFAAAVADSFARSYLATVESLRAGPAKRDTKEFDERIRTLRDQLEEAETKLANFQQKKGIVASDERLDLETGRLNELSAQLAMAQSQSAESQARQRQLREYLAGGRGDAPGEVWASPVVQQLRGSIAEREAKLSDLSQRLGPNHPTYQTASIELQKLRGQLSAEMRAAAESAVNASTVQPQREGSLRSSMEHQRSRVLQLKNDRNTLAILQREVDSARQSYEAVAQRLTQSRLAGDVGQAIGWIVDGAVVPTRPTSPNAPLNVALALVAGLVLGVGVALASESIDGYVRSERDIVELLEVPVLAVLSARGGRGRYLPAPNIHALPRA
jgi:succinoglycan biosynthesis transport protein ExoP